MLKYLIAACLLVEGCSSWHSSAVKGGYIGIEQGHSASSENIIRPYRDSLLKTMTEQIGICDADLYTEKPQGPLGNFVCDLLMTEIPLLSEYQWLRDVSHFSLLNTRGLRAPVPKGVVTIETIYSVMPFENEVVLMKMPKTTLPSLAQSITEKGGHPLSYNVTLVSIDGTHATLHLPKSDADHVWIITTDYLADGGDGMQFFREATERKNTGIKLRDIIIHHIRNLSSQGKTINASTDDRILFFR